MQEIALLLKIKAGRWNQKGEKMNKIEKRRRAKGLTRLQLAEKVGITYNAVLLYEKSKREPKAMVLKKMAKVLGCLMEDLI